MTSLLLVMVLQLCGAFKELLGVMQSPFKSVTMRAFARFCNNCGHSNGMASGETAILVDAAESVFGTSCDLLNAIVSSSSPIVRQSLS